MTQSLERKNDVKAGVPVLSPVHGVQLELRTEMMERQVYRYLFCKEEPVLVPNVGEALLAPVHSVQL